MPSQTGKTEIVVLTDDTIAQDGLMAEHGVSILVTLPNGRRWLVDTGTTDIYQENARRLGIRLDGLNRRGGLTGVTAVVKRGYVRRHKGQTLRFTLDGAPKASVTLEGDGEARVTL